MANANVTPTVHVIDDDDSFRTAMVRLLKVAGYAVRTYSSGTEFLRAHVPAEPGCILLDLFMPDETGLDVQALLAKRNDNLPLIFISGQGSIPDTVRAMQAGAVDFLTKPFKKEMLLKSIATAIANDQQARSLRDKLHDTEVRYRSLSPRQRSVFQGVVTGKLNKQMAADLGVAERTIKAHRAEVMKKMRADSVAQLVHISLQLGAESKRPARRA
jgi:FixJ family two-component response regulator